ncbi:hypothetical protein DSM106972_067430 [Dulcicalothrix desertica PCC 7102]|uniref:Conjugal transfer protein TrbI n=1 Tax=Dulcicalothrix desertica PCC 7102 TaxID=232991 RepID=A0A433V6C9_9CYAN|nr:TrbI/VirB10 family protein [Dulcicalothrix desertica]RUT01646.1 hypothetical protein DSM106972_067430 [Dulcicalothrix desertica PCC 7102]TWH43836.1 conjugative transfer protein TrbI [Dulcicalothrix desertica PCC 7102]
MQSKEHNNNSTEIVQAEASGTSNSNWDTGSFARLLGLSSEEVNFNSSTSENDEAVESDTQEVPNNVVSQSELFDDPQLGKTQPTFATNPFAKFGAVGLVMLVVFAAGATFLNTIMSGRPKSAPKTAALNNPKPKLEIDPNVNQQEAETGKLKAELALGSQAEKIKSVENSKNLKTPVRERKPINRPQYQIASAQVRPPQVYNPPRPSYQPARYYPPSIPSNRGLQPVINKAPIATPKNTVLAPTPIKQPTDPMEEWMAINRLGSYGGSEIASNFDTSNKNKPSNNTVDTVDNKQPTQITIPHATPVLTVSSETVETTSLEPLQDEEAAIINGAPIQQLTVGASARGKLTTPLVWGRNSNNNTDKNPTTSTEAEKFIVELTEPLTTEEGFVTLPKGSQIIAQVDNIQKSGFVELQATQVVIDGKEYVLPPAAISIRGNSGQPLMASKWGDKGGEIASRDAETFVVGSLAKVGKVLNQPKEEQIFNSSGFGGTTTFSSNRQSRTNILGAVLEGGFEPLTQQILERNQRALASIQQQEQVWYVKAGTNVQVFINKSFEF